MYNAIDALLPSERKEFPSVTDVTLNVCIRNGLRRQYIEYRDLMASRLEHRTYCLPKAAASTCHETYHLSKVSLKCHCRPSRSLAPRGSHWFGVSTIHHMHMDFG